jgi:GDP-D-mannose 3', 5'-epimerase
MLSVPINTHMLPASQQHDVRRFFYASSACVYAADKQTDPAQSRVEGERRLPGDAGGRLWLGDCHGLRGT